MKEVFQKGTVLSEREADYMVSLLANLIPAAMNIWYRHGKNESPGEVYYAVGQSLNIIKNQLFDLLNHKVFNPFLLDRFLVAALVILDTCTFVIPMHMRGFDLFRFRLPSCIYIFRRTVW